MKRKITIGKEGNPFSCSRNIFYSHKKQQVKTRSAARTGPRPRRLEKHPLVAVGDEDRTEQPLRFEHHYSPRARSSSSRVVRRALVTAFMSDDSLEVLAASNNAKSPATQEGLGATRRAGLLTRRRGAV